MACTTCEVIEGKKKSFVVYEDPQAIAFLADDPAVVGHIVVAPKKHSPIFEGMDDSITAHLFRIANKVSAAVFESIGAKGTNIIIHNGVAAGQESPHFCVNIISRRDDDGLIFDWAPKQLSEEEMATTELQLKKGLEKKPKVEPTAPEEPAAEIPETEGQRAGTSAPEGEQTSEKETVEEKKEEENYLVKQLRRMP